MTGLATNWLGASFSVEDVKQTAENGAVGHRELLAHTARLEHKLWQVGEAAWCFVGNGLANQTFVEGPEGLIAIDTGESVEEMTAAIKALRHHTQAPIVATIYTHSHYVNGTTAVLEPGAGPTMPIWGHSQIVSNRLAYGTTLSAVAVRGLIHQFGVFLPSEGPDALVNVGLGLSFRRAEHAPFTDGFVEPNRVFDTETEATIAGLKVVMTPAPSDSSDSITIWFPELGVCVHNLLWPTLFNIFAIRGEQYRDPRVLLEGLDHMGSLGAQHLIGAHGPPISGPDEIATEIIDYRDSIAFLWDQTVRGINKGLTADELSMSIELPERFSRSWRTRQWYGLAEHHVRQIYSGLRGWFDGDETKLMPLPPTQRCRRLVQGFGGAEAVRAQAREALESLDLRWALELAGWLIRLESTQTGRADTGAKQDRELLAEILREIAQRTTASNIRNWCISRARELEGLLDFNRFRQARFMPFMVMMAPPSSSVSALKVLLDPVAASGKHLHVRFEIDGDVSGILIRDSVAIPTDGNPPSGWVGDSTWVCMTQELLARVLAGDLTVDTAVSSSQMQVGDSEVLERFCQCFDHPGFRE